MATEPTAILFGADTAAMPISGILRGMRRIAFFFLLLAPALLGQQRLTAAAVANKSLPELRLMRGEIFGRHGRIFSSDRDIDEYLRKQSWYKPNRDFTNDELTAPEREDLDVIRHAEAARHAHVEPGDMRWWQSQVMTEAQLGEHTGAELRVLLAEIEAIHGKRFDELPTLQTYFDARYWYVPDPKYTPKRLSATERGNMAVIESAMRKQRKVVLLPGDMGGYMDKRITPEMLDGLGLHELRLLRNEIYARRGRVFTTDWLSEAFEPADWYHADPDFHDDMLTPGQKNNAAVIAARERELHEALSSKKIDPASLDGLFAEDLRVLRNEIYARHGRVFQNAGLRKYFSGLPWYKPDPSYDEASLSEIERANTETIKLAEKSAGSLHFEG